MFKGRETVKAILTVGFLFLFMFENLLAERNLCVNASETFEKKCRPSIGNTQCSLTGLRHHELANKKKNRKGQNKDLTNMMVFTGLLNLSRTN